MFYTTVKMIMLSLNITLIGWVLYCFVMEHVYGSVTLYEHNGALLIAEIATFALVLLVSFVVLAVEIKREINQPKVDIFRNSRTTKKRRDFRPALNDTRWKY